MTDGERWGSVQSPVRPRRMEAGVIKVMGQCFSQRRAVQAVSSQQAGVRKGKEVTWRWLINMRMKEGARH